ncbi:MAG: endonuclease/exonuclease/phosphatase family protein, partial [Candidatus Neomarinimicrobiota bacterium]
DFNYGVFASVWESQVILADGLGRINTGNAILSKWELKNAERIQLALRGDQEKLTKYFYLRRNVLKAEVNMPGTAGFYAVCVHVSAFATDDTKIKQIQTFKDILDTITADGGSFVAGGDLNALPPGADSTDFCQEDKCFGDSFHSPGDKPLHRGGSYFTTEADLLSILYAENTGYYPVISLADYLDDETLHFTHSSAKNPDLDRKLDYLWTNTDWISGSEKTHQEAKLLSDHMPVSASWKVPQ